MNVNQKFTDECTKVLKLPAIFCAHAITQIVFAIGYAPDPLTIYTTKNFQKPKLQ